MVLPFLTTQGVLSVKVVKGSMTRDELMVYLKEAIVSTISDQSIFLCLDHSFSPAAETDVPVSPSAFSSRDGQRTNPLFGRAD
jgi:hypothetical protein